MDDYKELVRRAKLWASSGHSKDLFIGDRSAAQDWNDVAEAIERLTSTWLSPETYEALMAERQETLHELAALKEHLATLKSASAEPVVWMVNGPQGGALFFRENVAMVPGVPLYRHPAPAAVQEDAKDAARYRHLKHDENFCIDERDCDGRWEPVGNLDAAIDDAMEANNAKP